MTPAGIDFMSKFLEYDPTKRMNAREALNHKWFKEEPRPTAK